MRYSNLSGTIGNQQIAMFGLPDTVERQMVGTILAAENNYWGAGEFIYVRATATIRQFGLVRVLPTFQTNAWRYDSTEVANTANLGTMLAVAMTAATVGQFFWACISGVVPINCNASVAADTAFGIAAAGQGGANSAGKQVLNSRIIAAATTTVAKTGVANSGSNQLVVSGDDGWFIGAYLSGTGIAASTVINDISADGTVVTLSANTTAAVNGTVTATYNNGTVFYNVAHINRPFAQGAIT